MKSKNKVLLGAAALALILPGGSKQANAATATLSAQAVIRQAISANFTQQLHFGNLSTTGTGAGSVLYNPVTNTRTPGGTLSLAGGALHQIAKLSVTAAKSAVLDISMPTLPVALVNGTKQMTIDEFRVFDTKTAATDIITGTGTANAVSVVMPTTGTANVFRVGGVLNKGAGLTLPTGTYKNAAITFNLNYQ